MFCLGSIRIALGEELEEITVTAQKREQSSQDVPLTISTLSGAELSKANIRDLFQIAGPRFQAMVVLSCGPMTVWR